MHSQPQSSLWRTPWGVCLIGKALSKALCIEITIKEESKKVTDNDNICRFSMKGSGHTPMHVCISGGTRVSWVTKWNFLYARECVTFSHKYTQHTITHTHTYVSMHQCVTYLSSRDTHAHTHIHIRKMDHKRVQHIFMAHKCHNAMRYSLPDYVFTSHRERKRVCNVTIIYPNVVYIVRIIPSCV